MDSLKVADGVSSFKDLMKVFAYARAYQRIEKGADVLAVIKRVGILIDDIDNLSDDEHVKLAREEAKSKRVREVETDVRI